MMFYRALIALKKSKNIKKKLIKISLFFPRISFPGELQLYFYNHILYENYTDAESQPNGLAVISILIQLIDNQYSKRNSISNEELNKLFETMDQIKYKGEINKFDIFMKCTGNYK